MHICSKELKNKRKTGFELTSIKTGGFAGKNIKSDFAIIFNNMCCLF